MNEKTKRRGWIYILAILLVIALLGGGLLAKYISQNRQEAEMISAGFHISSNYLEEGTPHFNVSDWGDGVDILLYNYEKENIAQIAEMAINYTVTVEHGTLESVKNGAYDVTPTGTVTATSGSYILPLSTDIMNHTIRVKPDDSGQDVIVTVKSTAPYSKELKASFNVSAKTLPAWTFAGREDGNTALLTIKTNDYAGTVTVNWPSAIYSPDNSDLLMKTWVDSTPTGTLTVEANSTYTLLFFKDTAAAVTAQSGDNSTTITIN